MQASWLQNRCAWKSCSDPRGRTCASATEEAVYGANCTDYSERYCQMESQIQPGSAFWHDLTSASARVGACLVLYGLFGSDGDV